MSSDDSQASTRALMVRGRAGDPSAWERVFGRVMRRVRIWAHGRVSKAWAAQGETRDLVQDAALTAWTRLDHLDFQKPGDLDAYMRTVVINRIRDQARRRHARPPMVSLDAQVPDVADGRPSALDHALDAEALGRYERAFAALDVSDREALIARVEMGYTFEQIAQLTGRPSAAAARMAVTRAIGKLRQAVRGDAS